VGCKFTQPRFGQFVVQASKSCFVTRNQLEAVRISLRRPIKTIKTSKVWVSMNPNIIITKRAAETRMGRGKGAPFKQIFLVTKGQILFEISGPSIYKMKDVFKKASKKLPIPVNLLVINDRSL